MIREKSVLLFLDKKHLSDSLFMKLFGQKLVTFSRNKTVILLHGDSNYTEELHNNGMSIEDARIRATKEINQRLISLLADNGISAISMHGYHKNSISIQDGNVNVSNTIIQSLPPKVILVLSNLCMHTGNGNLIEPFYPVKIAQALKADHKEMTLLSFAVSEKASLSFENHKPGFADLLNFVPEEILVEPKQFKLTTLSDLDSKDQEELSIDLDEL